MKFGKLFILLAAAGSGAAVYKIRHPGEISLPGESYFTQSEPEVQEGDPNTYDTLTGDGSLYKTFRTARDESEAKKESGGLFGGDSNNNSPAPSFSGGIGSVGGAGISSRSRYARSSGMYDYGGSSAPQPADDLEILQAAAKGDKKAVQQRIAAGVKIDSRDSERRTPLMYAAANGFDDIIDRLVAAGANPNFKDRNGNNAFDYAAGRGLVETVQHLLKGTHTKDDRHYVEFAQTIRAAYAGDVSLLPAGNGPLSSVNRITPAGQAPLHIVAGNGAIKVMEALLKRGAEVNLTNSNEQTPLHWAAWNNQVNSASVLLDNGACVFQGEAAGNTALMLAAQSNSKDVAKLLIAKGAEKGEVNKLGKTAAMQAEDRGFKDLSTILK